MKTPILRIIFALLLISSTAAAQKSDCHYEDLMRKGEKAFRKGDYLEALNKFDLALEGCDEVTIEKQKFWVKKRKKATQSAIEKMLKGYKDAEQKAQDALYAANQALDKMKIALAEAEEAKKEAEEAKLKARKYSAEIKANDINFFKNQKEEIEAALKEYNIEEAKDELKDLQVSKDVSPKDIDALDKKIKAVIDELIPEMVAVQGRYFNMGCTGKDCDDDNPQHQRILTSFRIGISEVTQGLWKKIMGKNSNPFEFKGDDFPVESVNYEEVSLFIRELCKKTGKKFRLPTEAEWEYAAIGGHKANQLPPSKKKDFEYSGNNNLVDCAWAKGNSTHQVCTRKPNQLGIYDMSGNVMEWCEDYYDYRFYTKIKNKNKLDQAQRQKINRDDRVVRGGAFYNDGHRDNSDFCKVTTRYYQSANTKKKNLGFRLVQELDEKK